MKKADKTKLLYVIGISLVLFMFGCVDTNVQNVPSSIDYHSQVKFVNLIDSVGTATISVNGNSMGSAAFTKSLYGPLTSEISTFLSALYLNILLLIFQIRNLSWRKHHKMLCQ